MDRGAVDARVGAFVYDRQLASFAYAAKSARAVWDPDLDGFRCPEGVTNGGQITNRFGVGCGVGVTRRLVNMVGNAGRAVQRADDQRRQRPRQRPQGRNRRRGLADRLDAGIQGVMGRAADLLGDESESPQRRPTSRAAERATSVDVARQRTPSLPSRQRQATQRDEVTNSSDTDPEVREWLIRVQQHEEALADALDRMRDGEDVRQYVRALLNDVVADQEDVANGANLGRLDDRFSNLIDRVMDAVDGADQRFATPDNPRQRPDWERPVALIFGEFEQAARDRERDDVEADELLDLMPRMRAVAADEAVPAFVRRQARDNADILGEWINEAYDQQREREQMMSRVKPASDKVPAAAVRAERVQRELDARIYEDLRGLPHDWVDFEDLGVTREDELREWERRSGVHSQQVAQLLAQRLAGREADPAILDRLDSLLGEVGFSLQYTMNKDHLRDYKNRYDSMLQDLIDMQDRIQGAARAESPAQQVVRNWADEARRYNVALDRLERDLPDMTQDEAYYYLNQQRDDINRDIQEGVGSAAREYALLQGRVNDLRSRIARRLDSDSSNFEQDINLDDGKPDLADELVDSPESLDPLRQAELRVEGLANNPEATPDQVRQEARRLWRVYNDQLRAGDDGIVAARYRELAQELFGLADERELAENRRDAVDGRVAAALDAGAASEDIKEMEKKAEDLVKAAKKRRLKILADYLTKRYGDDAPWLDPERSPVGKDAWREMYRAARSGDQDAIDRLQQWKRDVYEHEEIIGAKGLRMRTVLKNPGGWSLDTIEGDIQAFNEATGVWENVGNFTRTIQNAMGRNSPTIYNALMVIGKEAGYNNPFAESAKAQGFQTIFNPHAFMRLKAAGFRGAGVSAAWNGRYVWGRVGFRPRQAGAYRGLADRVDEELARFRNGEDSWVLNEAQAALLGVLTTKARRVNYAPAKAPGHADYLAVLDAPGMNPGVDLSQRKEQLEEAWTNDWRLQFGSGFFKFAGNVPDDPRGRRRRRAA